jgi:hypothetical protein
MALSLSFQGKVRVSSREKLTTTNAGILRYAQDDDGTDNSRSLGDDKQKDKQGQSKGQATTNTLARWWSGTL